MLTKEVSSDFRPPPRLPVISLIGPRWPEVPILVSDCRAIEFFVDEVGAIDVHMAARRPRSTTELGASIAHPRDVDAAGHILPLYDAAAAQLLRFVRRTRALREEFFSVDLFSDPAWEMLLYLYEAEITQQRPSIRDIPRQTKVAPTTVLRWLEALEGQGFIVRTPDPSDGRRVFVSLSDEALARMDGLFVAIEDELEAAHLRRTPR